MPTDTEIIEMEKFYEKTHLPKVFKLNAATTINDLPEFVQNGFRLIRMPDVADLVIRLRWEELCEIRNLIEKVKVGESKV